MEAAASTVDVVAVVVEMGPFVAVGEVTVEAEEVIEVVIEVVKAEDEELRVVRSTCKWLPLDESPPANPNK